MTAVVLVLWFAQPAIAITGGSTCPTPGEVQDRLVALALPSDQDGAANSGAHQVNVSSEGSSVHVELLAQDGQLLAERTLESAGSCSDVAEAVAVIVSAWEAELRPNLVAPVVRLPAPAPYEPVSESTQTVETKPRHQRTFDAGIAALVSMAGGSSVFGLKLEGCAFLLGTPLALDAALSATSTRTQSIAGPGGAEWSRVAWSAAPAYRFRRGSAMVDIHAGGVLALLHVQGTGLGSVSSDTTLQLGLEAGLRVLWAWNNAAGWLGAYVFAFPGQDRLVIGNVGEVGQLPRAEAQIALGISMGRFR